MSAWKLPLWELGALVALTTVTGLDVVDSQSPLPGPYRMKQCVWYTPGSGLLLPQNQKINLFLEVFLDPWGGGGGHLCFHWGEWAAYLLGLPHFQEVGAGAWGVTQNRSPLGVGTICHHELMAHVSPTWPRYASSGLTSLKPVAEISSQERVLRLPSPH